MGIPGIPMNSERKNASLVEVKVQTCSKLSTETADDGLAVMMNNDCDLFNVDIQFYAFCNLRFSV